MSIEITRAQIAIMQAYCEGEQIQYRDWGTDVWCDTTEPEWFWNDCEYRIKPETIRYRVWLWEIGDGRIQPAISFQDVPPGCKGFIRWLTDWQEIEI